MSTYRGFSLIEVLLSLLLISSLALKFLELEWRIKQSFNQNLLRSKAVILLDNASERLRAGQVLSRLEKPFQLKNTAIHQGNLLELSWQPLTGDLTKSCYLKRELVKL